MAEWWQLSEAEADELARYLHRAIESENATFERVGEGGLSRDELRALVRETTTRFRRERRSGAEGAVHESGTGRRAASEAMPLSETTGDERRLAMAEAADRLVPTLPWGAIGAPTSPAPEKLPHEMDRDEFRAFKDARAHELLPGNEYGVPDPKGSQ